MKTARIVNRLSPALFALAILLFFLPFVLVSCAGERVATLSGIQLVTGTTVKQGGELDADTQVEPQPLAIAAFACGFVGLGLSFLKSRRTRIGPAIVGLGGLILLLLKAKVDRDVAKEAQGALEARYAAGFWLTGLLFLCAAALNTLAFVRKEPADRQPPEKDLVRPG